MMTKPKKDKRSPLKSRPLRYPGQSLDEEIEQIYDENATPYLFISILAITLVALEWFWFALDTRPNPMVVTLFAIAVIAFSVYRVVKLRKQFKSLKLGRDGERVVGQYLEILRESGCRVFHDIVGDGFNIDHVILSHNGIFTVETKTYSKPARGKPEVEYDGQRILVDGREPDNDIVVQAVAQRDWLSEILESSTAKRFPVKAVIVFPGWYVESRGKAGQYEVWVLNPKALPKFIQNEHEQLAVEDMSLASFHLARYIRSIAQN